MVIAVIPFVSAIVSNAKTYSYENLHRSYRPIPDHYFIGNRILIFLIFFEKLPTFTLYETLILPQIDRRHDEPLVVISRHFPGLLPPRTMRFNLP